ncbi:MAG TPA: DNA-binding response regulator [Candidatus Omnitrophica bacterium]|nr:DNA-binding response regulator [Candidatus Omnitrophota bacterium]HCI45340.1 DNA-binding response regulator [Candidatus Omnitrophota bacterium]
MGAVYRIILADDHQILRAGLKDLIEKDKAFKVAGQAKDGDELLSLMHSVKCDLVIMDLSMPGCDGMQAIQEVRVKFPKVKVLVLTMQKDQEHFKHAMAHGASGYVLKEDAYDQLLMAVKMVLRGKKFVSPTISRLLTDYYVRSLDEAESSSLDILTKREQQILQFIGNGMANKNIASKLKLSIRTVETHRANLSHKLGIKNTAGLVKYALSKGLA